MCYTAKNAILIQPCFHTFFFNFRSAGSLAAIKINRNQLAHHFQVTTIQPIKLLQTHLPSPLKPLLPRQPLLMRSFI